MPGAQYTRGAAQFTNASDLVYARPQVSLSGVVNAPLIGGRVRFSPSGAEGTVLAWDASRQLATLDLGAMPGTLPAVGDLMSCPSDTSITSALLESASSTSITDTDAAWVTNEFGGDWMRTGTQDAQIVSNDATNLNFSAHDTPLSPVPSGGDTYQIFEPCSGVVAALGRNTPSAWDTEVTVGDWVARPGSQRAYRVVTVAQWSLQLERAYEGDTEDGVPYVVGREFDPVIGVFPLMREGDIEIPAMWNRTVIEFASRMVAPAEGDVIAFTGLHANVTIDNVGLPSKMGWWYQNGEVRFRGWFSSTADLSPGQTLFEGMPEPHAGYDTPYFELSGFAAGSSRAFHLSIQPGSTPAAVSRTTTARTWDWVYLQQIRYRPTDEWVALNITL